MKIISGTIKKAQRIVLYGPEGIGKSTFGSQFPNPIFIDTEGSTEYLDVDRIKPQTFNELKKAVTWLINKKHDYETVIIDTLDWTENLAESQVRMDKNVASIEDIGYGKGFVFVRNHLDDLVELLNTLRTVREVHVVLLAHCDIVRCDPPNEAAYDRYEMKLRKKNGRIFMEWADMVLFANYDVIVIDNSNEGKKNKAQGGRRVMFSQHCPSWDAKNRHSLKNKLPFEYKSIADAISFERTVGDPPEVRLQKLLTLNEVTLHDYLVYLNQLKDKKTGNPKFDFEVTSLIDLPSETLEAMIKNIDRIIPQLKK